MSRAAIKRAAIYAACEALGLDPSATASIHIEGAHMTVYSYDKTVSLRKHITYRIED